jgi:hypothetical protein
MQGAPLLGPMVRHNIHKDLEKLRENLEKPANPEPRRVV